MKTMATLEGAESELVTFGELVEGDVILGPDGSPVAVTRAYDPHLPERMYELELEDGTTIQASGSHLWYVEPASDLLAHGLRLKEARRLLKPKDWREEALTVAEAEEPYEIALSDLMNFFDFIKDERSRYFLLVRVLESLGPIVEEEVIREDYLTGELVDSAVEKVYDARRVFQQLLSLTGDRTYRRRWPVVVGRVVTTDVLFHRYPEANIPTLDSPRLRTQ